MISSWSLWRFPCFHMTWKMSDVQDINVALHWYNAQVICCLSCLHALHAYVHIYRYRLNMNKHKAATRQQHVRAMPGHERVINYPTVQADHHHHHHHHLIDQPTGTLLFKAFARRTNEQTNRRPQTIMNANNAHQKECNIRFHLIADNYWTSVCVFGPE